MRYPLLAFLVVFVIPPFTAHALLAGKARLRSDTEATFTTTVIAAVPADKARTHNWTVTPTFTVR